MATAPRARRMIDSNLPARPTTMSRTSLSFSFLSTSRLVARNSLMIIMTQKASVTASTSSSTSQQHALKPRQQPAPDASNSQSLTFGLAFMAILILLLFFAHMMQRVANRRQREVLERMAALQESREFEEVPKLWDVHLRRLRYDGFAIGTGPIPGTEVGLRWKVKERSRWKDIQPLSAAITSDPDKQTSAGPHDRPLRISVVIAMPVSTRKRMDRDKRVDYDSAEDGPPYFELGVTTIK
ncbi:hypothetical protein ACEPAG_8779 [Sanghuangporus baumii]